MVLDDAKISEISGLGDYTVKTEAADKQGMPKQARHLYQKPEEGKTFLVLNNNTIEVRTDAKLASLLKEKYESVMDSRYFGKGGIEIVLADQLHEDEIADLIRLSYNLT